MKQSNHQIQCQAACLNPMTAHIISTARHRSGLQQQEFMEKHGIDVSQATFSRWESGIIQVSAEVMLKLGLVQAVQS